VPGVHVASIVEYHLGLGVCLDELCRKYGCWRISNGYCMAHYSVKVGGSEVYVTTHGRKPPITPSVIYTRQSKT
jgi:hypothetical protein